jgi:hypothetical protein
MRENGEKESPKFNQLMEDENVHDSEENKYNNLSFKEISSKDSLSSSNYSFSKTIIYDKYEEENDSSNHISKRNNFGQKLENFNNSKNESKNIVFTNNILKISKHQNSIIKNKNNSGLKKALNKTISSNSKSRNKIKTKTLSQLLNQNIKVGKLRMLTEQYENNKKRATNNNEYDTDRNPNTSEKRNSQRDTNEKINIIKANKLEKANSRENLKNESMISKFISKRKKTNDNTENEKFQNQFAHSKDKKKEIPIQLKDNSKNNNNIINYNNNQKNNNSDKNKPQENNMPISDDYQNYTRVERRINNVEILIGKMSGYMEKLDGYVDSQKKKEENLDGYMKNLDEYMASQKTMNYNLLQILQKLSGV